MDNKIKLKESNTPLVVSINKKNISIYFDMINSILLSNNFIYIKTFGSKYWENYLYNTEGVELSFNDIKKIVKKHFADIEFQENAYQMDETSVDFEPSEENDTLLQCYELWCPFIKVN